MEYVIKVDQGFLKYDEHSNQIVSALVSDVNDATVFTSTETRYADLVGTFNANYYVKQATSAGGKNPEIVPVQTRVNIITRDVQRLGMSRHTMHYFDPELQETLTEVDGMLCQRSEDGFNEPILPMSSVTVVDDE